jgi:hypothetical protein
VGARDEWLLHDKNAATPVAKILKLLAPVEEGLLAAQEAALQAQPKFRRQARALDDYSIQRSAEGGDRDVLVESRPGGRSQPMRCPRDVYDATVRVLAHAERPLSFEDILTGVQHLPMRDVTYHPVRVALRFLLSMTPPSIMRRTAKYAAHHPQGLVPDANRAWGVLAGVPGLARVPQDIEPGLTRRLRHSAAARRHRHQLRHVPPANGARCLHAPLADRAWGVRPRPRLKE